MKATSLIHAETPTKKASECLEDKQWTKGVEKMMLARANLDMAIAYVTSRHPIGIPEGGE